MVIDKLKHIGTDNRLDHDRVCMLPLIVADDDAGAWPVIIGALVLFRIQFLRRLILNSADLVAIADLNDLAVAVGNQIDNHAVNNASSC